MPTIASRSTSAAVRRARRRERRIGSRARVSAIFTYNSAPAVRKRAARRQNRDQASFGLENCFNLCQETAFHCDPDVHIGWEASEVNQFAVLDPEASAPSLPTPPDSEFTLNLPPPRATPKLAPPASSSDVVLGQPSSTQGRLILRKYDWPPSCKSDPSESLSTPPLPSIPTTPPGRARVKLPCTYPVSTHDTSPSTRQTPTKDYFDDIKIPSPLLYHRRSREQLLTRSSDTEIGAELTKKFLLACGRDVPEPDFESYKIFDEPRSQSKSTASGISLCSTALQTVDDILHKQRDFAFQNIPQPPWIVQLYHPNPQTCFKAPPWSVSSKPPPTMPPRPPPTPPILTNTNTFSIAQLDIPSKQTRTADRCLDFSLQLAASGCDLGFPQLPAPPPRLISVTQKQNKNRKPLAFIEDDPDEIEKGWQAFEDAVSNPKRRNSSSEVTVITRLKNAQSSWIVQQPKPQPLFDYTSCRASDCLALVPAQLYRDRFIGRSPNFINVRSLRDKSPAQLTSGAVDDKTEILAEWIADLGMEVEHTKGCAVTLESACSSEFGLEHTFEVESKIPSAQSSGIDSAMLEPHPASADSEVLVLETLGLDSTDSMSLDEGYFSGDGTIDADGGDATMSRDEWADWNWDDGLLDQDDIGHDQEEDLKGLAASG